MKLRNKKTGEIIDGGFVLTYYDGIAGNPQHSLAELNEEWEDVPEEPKEYWYIDPMVCGVYCTKIKKDEDLYDFNKQIGNYFETEEEAEKAVEKLEALKRLKDKGFKFILDGETEMPMFVYSGANGEKCITSAEESKQCRDDIKLLFSQEDD